MVIDWMEPKQAQDYDTADISQNNPFEETINIGDTVTQLVGWITAYEDRQQPLQTKEEQQEEEIICIFVWSRIINTCSLKNKGGMVRYRVCFRRFSYECLRIRKGKDKRTYDATYTKRYQFSCLNNGMFMHEYLEDKGASRGCDMHKLTTEMRNYENE